MTEEEVFEVLKGYVCDQLEDDVDEADVTIDKSMMDLGANSLDVVEIVSNTMRELKIKIPREELGQFPTMEGLCQKMADYKNQQ